MIPVRYSTGVPVPVPGPVASAVQEVSYPAKQKFGLEADSDASTRSVCEGTGYLEGGVFLYSIALTL